MTGRYFFFFLAAAAYACFLAGATASRLPRRRAPFRQGFVWHAFGALGYALVSALVILIGRTAGDWHEWSDALVGLYCYVAFHYAFTLIVFGQITRGFSVGLCVDLYQSGGRLPLARLLQSADHGRASQIKRDRANVMLECGCARSLENGTRIGLSTRGHGVERVNRAIQVAWSLDFLGKPTAEPEA